MKRATPVDRPMLGNKWVNMLLQAAKMAVGCPLAVYIASTMQLEFMYSAGIITMLTIATTRMETLQLSALRVLSFTASAGLSWVLFKNISNSFLAYGIFLLLLFTLFEIAGWQATISVNVVIASHFLSTPGFGIAFVQNELLLVIIGVAIAIVLNLFTANNGLARKIKHNVEYSEAAIYTVLQQLADYLTGQQPAVQVWEETSQLEADLQKFILQAYEYQGNSLRKNNTYYTAYFEMRLNQCALLRSLHGEMQRIRSVPPQAAVVAEYIRYLSQHVLELNDPAPQLEALQTLLENMKNEPLPQTREEFENRALLYHVLMDLEVFLLLKRKFLQAAPKAHAGTN